MNSIIGLTIVIITVFVPYALNGGSLVVLMHAFVYEGTTIAGAGLGAFIIANTPDIYKRAANDIKLCFKGPRWKKIDYQDMLCLMFGISKLMKQKGVSAIENHIDKPQESILFNPYPNLLADHFLINLICDTIRMLTMNLTDAYQVDDIVNKQLEKHHEELTVGATALQSISDALPAIGIVAAVLGVIKTMASIDKPPSIIGAMIGSALVGTFSGVFFAYCLVGPLGIKAKIIHEKNSTIYLIFREVLVSHMKGNSSQISIELARALVPTEFQPTFFDLEEALAKVKIP